MADRLSGTKRVEAATSAYVRDILSQPERLAALNSASIASAVSPIAKDVGRWRRIVLTGMGASLAALRPLWLSLVENGRPAWLLETSEAIASCLPLVEDGTLAIVASQSGRSAEIVVFAQEARERGARILAVTNDTASPLAGAADAIVDIAAGAEAAVSTKTFANTLAACLAIGQCLAGHETSDDAARAADQLDQYLRTWRERVDAIQEAVGLPERLVYLARGASLAPAQYGALIAKEAAKRPVEALSAAQFRHGPMELADERLTAILLPGGPGRQRELALALGRDLAALGAKLVHLDSEPGTAPLGIPPGDGGARLILEAIPLQLMTISLAELSGVEPGAFRHLQKVTTEL